MVSMVVPVNYGIVLLVHHGIPTPNKITNERCHLWNVPTWVCVIL